MWADDPRIGVKQNNEHGILISDNHLKGHVLPSFYRAFPLEPKDCFLLAGYLQPTMS